MGAFKEMKTNALTVVHFASGDLWAGAEVQLFTLCKYLNRNKKINVKVILLNEGELAKRLRNEGIEVIVFDESRINAFQIYLKVNHQIKTWRTDILHTHRQKENIIGGITAKLNRIKSVRTVHGAPEHESTWRMPHKKLIIKLDQLIAKYFHNKIISVSSELTKKLYSLYSKEKVITVENGVDLELLQPHKKNPLLIFKNEIITIGLVGRLVPVKQVELFIDTANSLIKSHNNKFKFVIYGDGPLKKSLNKKINDLELSDIVTLMGHRRNILDCINKLDILIITSKHEGLPITLLEAMAIGVPVISTNVGCIPTVIKNGVSGMLVNSMYPEEICKSIESTINSIQKTISMVKNARLQVNENYSATLNADKVQLIYQELT